MNDQTYTEWADQDDDAQAEDGERLPTDCTAVFFGQS
jgi:hypothetical protein